MGTYRVKPGDKITVNIEDETPRPSAVGRPPSFVGVDPTEDQLYVFRKKAISIFNLAQVLNEDGDYIFLNGALPDTVFETFTPPADPTLTPDADWTTFVGDLQAAMLATAFESTDGLPNRERLKFAAEDLFVDVIQRTIDEPKHTVIGTPDTRDLIENTLHATTYPKADLWKPAGDERGALKPVGTLTSLKVNGFAFFLSFDTDDTVTYKVTETASVDADAVVPALGDLTGIYLVPPLLNFSLQWRLLANSGTASQQVVGFSINVVRMLDDTYRLPLKTNAELVRDPTTGFADGAVIVGPTKASMIDDYVDSGAYDEMATWPALFMTYLNTDSTVPGIIAGRPWTLTATDRGLMRLFDYDDLTDVRINRLRAVLKTKSHTYYVWTRPDDWTADFVQHGPVGAFEVAHGFITGW